MDWRELAGPSRLETMQSAIVLLKQWQESTYRLPVLENPGAFHEEKERIAKMLVDHNLGKLGRRVRSLGVGYELDSATFLDDWAEITLMTKLWSRFETLSDGLRLNLIYQSGPNITRKHLSCEKPLEDQFVVVGMELSQEEALLRRSVYLFGLEANRFFVIIDFAFNQQPFDRYYEVGALMRGTVVRYPFPGSLRISPLELQSRPQDLELRSKIPSETIFNAVRSFFKLLRVNPFAVPFPALVRLRSDFSGEKWYITDGERHEVRIYGLDPGIASVFHAISFQRLVLFTVLITREGIKPVSYFNGAQWFPIQRRSDKAETSQPRE